MLRKVLNKVLRAPRLCRGSIGDWTQSTFFGTSLGTNAFSPKKGLVFAVNGARRPRPPPPPKTFPVHTPGPPPSPLLEEPPPSFGIFSKTPTARRKGRGRVAGGGGGGRWPGGGGGRGPIYRENEPLFRRKRLTPFRTTTFRSTFSALFLAGASALL